MTRRPSRTMHRAALISGPMTTRAAADAGWTPSAQRHAVRVGDLERLQRGVVDLVTPADPSSARRAVEASKALHVGRAAALACPRAVLSHACAATALGIPTVGHVSRPCLTVQAGTALRKLARVHLHRATLLDDDVRAVDGYAVTSHARTVMDVARERGVAAGLVAADYVLHERLANRAELAAAFDQCATWPGRSAARITLRLADERTESPLESLSRFRMTVNGIPAPRPQPAICDEYGRYLGRCDFYWDEFGVVGESDGKLKYAPELVTVAITEERRREQALEATGLIVVRWGWSDLFEFEAVKRRLESAFRRGVRRGSPERRWGILRPAGRLHP